MTGYATHGTQRAGRVTSGPDWLTLAAAVGAAVNAGVFFSWSAMVMPAVRDLPTAQAIEAMQVLNQAAPAPFSLLGFGTTALCVAVIVRALRTWGIARAWWMLGGSVVFILAAIVITFAANVPLSYSIDQLSPSSATDAEWRDLYNPWVWANHLRGLGSIAAAAALAMAALRPSR